MPERYLCLSFLELYCIHLQRCFLGPFKHLIWTFRENSEFLYFNVTIFEKRSIGVQRFCAPDRHRRVIFPSLQLYIARRYQKSKLLQFSIFLCSQYLGKTFITSYSPKWLLIISISGRNALMFYMEIFNKKR